MYMYMYMYTYVYAISTYIYIQIYIPCMYVCIYRYRIYVNMYIYPTSGFKAPGLLSHLGLMRRHGTPPIPGSDSETPGSESMISWELYKVPVKGFGVI